MISVYLWLKDRPTDGPLDLLTKNASKNYESFKNRLKKSKIRGQAEPSSLEMAITQDLHLSEFTEIKIAKIPS